MEDAIADLAPEVSRYDPRLALSGGADGLAAYRNLVPQAARLLGAGGVLALEVGAGQAGEVERLLDEAGLVGLGRARDLAGLERCVLATSRADTKANTTG
jgi:release factor glutamine methyltransferase